MTITHRDYEHDQCPVGSYCFDRNFGVEQTARLVSRMLATDQKLYRLEISRSLLARFQCDPVNYHKRIVTQDETLVQHFDPE